MAMEAQRKAKKPRLAGSEPEPTDIKGPLHTPTVKEIISDKLTRISLEYWIRSNRPTNVKPFDPKVIEDIYYKELGEHKRISRIMLLELSFYLENYLWPNFDPKQSTFAHFMSIILMVNEKFRENVPAWDCFHKNPEQFPVFFVRTLELRKNPNMTLREKTDYTVFLINCFQSLENEMVSKQVLGLVSLKLWHHVSEGRREQEFNQHKKLRRRFYKKRKIDTKGTENSEDPDFDKNFIFDIIKDYMKTLFSIKPIPDVTPETPTIISPGIREAVRFCERFIELMIDLISQLSTRRFLRVLLEDIHFIIRSRRSPLVAMNEGSLFKKLLSIMRFYEGFEINDFTGEALTDDQMHKQHYYKMKTLQHTAYKNFQFELRRFALSNIGSIDTRNALEDHLKTLSNDQLLNLCEKLHLSPPEVQIPHLPSDIDHRSFLLEVLISAHEKRQSQLEQLNRDPLYPNETLLWDPNMVPDDHYAGDTCLALPKLNVQFLTFHDYFLRNYTLYRLESTYEIRYDIEDAVKRIQARLTQRGVVEFEGWARMAVPISEFKVTKVANPEIGSPVPAEVTAEVSFTIPQPGTRSDDQIKKEWDSLKQYDVMFLITVRPPPPQPFPRSGAQANGDQEDDPKNSEGPEVSAEMDPPDITDTPPPTSSRASFLKKYGLIYVRGCEVFQVLDEENNVISEPNPEKKPQRTIGRKRKIKLFLDPAQYQLDKDNGREVDVYKGFNLLIRRRAKENNFKAVLETIRDIMNANLKVPGWLHDVFLGYGDPKACFSTSTPIRTIDFNDTFILKKHLESCFPNRKIVYTTDDESKLIPPFKVTFPEGEVDVADANPEADADADAPPLIVEPKVLPNPGPYPRNQPKKNTVPFTPVQVHAIKRAMNTGLTLVVGPPGTGKTDVAVQIINNWYHNFPNQRTLIVTHSNQALNQIFEKITYLDIDERHLLRLGHGQEQLETERDFSKFGRVNYMLALRLELLREVTKLAESIRTVNPEDVAYTCETAHHFFVYHVLSRMEEFEERCERNLRKIRAGEKIEEPVVEVPVISENKDEVDGPEEESEVSESNPEDGDMGSDDNMDEGDVDPEDGNTESGKTEDGKTYDDGKAENEKADNEKAKSGITESGITESGITESGITESENPESGITESGITKSGITESGITESGITESGITESGITEGGKTENTDVTKESRPRFSFPMKKFVPGGKILSSSEKNPPPEKEKETKKEKETRKIEKKTRKKKASKKETPEPMTIEPPTPVPEIPKTPEQLEASLVALYFPFKDFFSDVPGLFRGESFEVDMEVARGCFRYVRSIFDQLSDCRAFELLKSSYDRGNYLLMKQAKIIAMTCTHAALKRRELIHLGFKFDNILMEEAAQILEIETFIPILLQDQDPEAPPRLKRIVLIGDHNQLPPVVKNMAIQKYGHLDQSLFSRFVRLGVPTLELDSQGRARPAIATLYNWRYKRLGDLPHVRTSPEFHLANAGFLYEYQVINVEDYNNRGEITPNPYFYQNLGEAEYLVAVYMYMRMIGYPATKITVLTSYNGQKHLLRDVIRRRCANNPRFGWPAKVTTVDRYQGQQNDYVLLSLVRTKTVGHIRDIRRLVVAMSRARLGLYVFCRKNLFANCYELTNTFSKFLLRPDKLVLVQNEFYQTQRKVDQMNIPTSVIFEVQDVVHMGQIVNSR